MRKIIKDSIMAVLLILMVLATASCKKEGIKKIAVDNQFAILIYNDTISLKQILNDMDSTTNSWIRVRNDSIFAYYADSVNGVLKASDLLGGLDDVDFTTNTMFTMPEFVASGTQDTVIAVDKFMTIPFHYDGFSIQEVELRKGILSFGIELQPAFPELRKVEIYSNQLLSPSGEPLSLEVECNKGSQSVDLANYSVIPEDDTVAFGARITMHITGSSYQGGDYQCISTGGLTGVGFKTVYAIVTKTLDSLFYNENPIDFGVKGLSGSALLPVPKINITYRNTFGLTADGDITKLQFLNEHSGYVTDLLAADHVDVDIYPTNGLYRNFTVTGFTDQIEALAGYTHLDFGGRVTMALPGDRISISDTSTVDVIGDIEMPLSFKLTDLRYIDTFDVTFGNDVSIQNYFDEIDFFIDYDNKIPIQLVMQGLFLRHGHVIDSLFDDGGSILYNEPATLECVITDDKVKNVMRANQMVMRLGVSTEFQNDPVMILESEHLALRMKMLTKTTEIDLN